MVKNVFPPFNFNMLVLAMILYYQGILALFHQTYDNYSVEADTKNSDCSKVNRCVLVQNYSGCGWCWQSYTTEVLHEERTMGR